MLHLRLVTAKIFTDNFKTARTMVLRNVVIPTVLPV